MTRSDLPEIKQGLKDRIADLCRELLPDGQRRGRFWVAHNPVTGDYQQTPEFKVAMDRDIGAWIDWRSGDKGDVIRLVEYVKGGDFKEAMAWSRDFLGLARMSSDQRRQISDRARETRARDERDAEANRLKRMGQAEKIWNAGFMDGSGSTAEAYALAYFAARAIPLQEIEHRDRQTFRFAAAQEFWPRAQWSNEGGQRRKLKAGPAYPAVLSAMRLATGQLAAVHMTFLSPLGPRKLPVSDGENAKIMFGEAKGAVIRISHGPEGEPPETAGQAHPLLLGEGVETTASVARTAPEARAWAGGSLSNMENAPVWLPCVSSIVVLKDHFKHRATETQFDRMIETLSRHGKPLAVIETHVGNDFNDLIQDDEGEEE